MRRALTLVVDLLIATAVLIGLLWLLTWMQTRPTSPARQFPAPAGLPEDARVSAVLVLIPALLALIVWLTGHRWGRFFAIAPSVALAYTASGWERIPGVESLRLVSLAAGIALFVVACLPWQWPMPPERGINGPRLLRIIVVVLLLPVLAVALDTAWHGWDLGLHFGGTDEAENGWRYLVSGLSVTAACAVAAWQLLSRPPIDRQAERLADRATGRPS